jgi:hypothetical protein
MAASLLPRSAQFIGEVLAGNGPQCGRFSDALRAFEDQAAIGIGGLPRAEGAEPASNIRIQKCTKPTG